MTESKPGEKPGAATAVVKESPTHPPVKEVAPPKPAEVAREEAHPDESAAPTIVYEEHFAEERHAPPPQTKDGFGPVVKGQGRVAVIIDDLGYNGPVSMAIAKLPADLTLAVLPGGDYSRRVASTGKESGREVILHQPMEPKGYPKLKPGPGALLSGMSDAEIEKILTTNLKSFPEVVGINNHMGSKLTGDRRVMAKVMSLLKPRGLFFVDSRTSPASVGTAMAAAHQVAYASRDVFLDNVPQEGEILKQLAILENQARKHGEAVGIGHPYPATLSALKSWLPGLKGRGVELVRVSQFLEPKTARAHYPHPLVGGAKEESKR
ncbi:MAG: divergent polysaccharide deacetylase family protein [Magnetococcales bacterium]|nr:divergent polysaccharide deacetylase family protein [Magnetococcales bacterium]